MLLAPAPRIAPNRVVAALVAERPQLLVNADQASASRAPALSRSPPAADRARLSRPELGPRLDLPFIRKRRLALPQNPRTVLRDRCSARAISLMTSLCPDARAVFDRSSPQQASPTTRFAPKRAADPTENRGVNFARRNTVRDIAWKAQVRLCARYRRLAAAGKPKVVVTTAIARETVGFLWAIARQA